MVIKVKEPDPAGVTDGRGPYREATMRRVVEVWATSAQLAAGLNLFQRFAGDSPKAAHEMMLQAIALKHRLDLEWKILLDGLRAP